MPVDQPLAALGGHRGGSGGTAATRPGAPERSAAASTDPAIRRAGHVDPELGRHVRGQLRPGRPPPVVEPDGERRDHPQALAGAERLQHRRVPIGDVRCAGPLVPDRHRSSRFSGVRCARGGRANTAAADDGYPVDSATDAMCHRSFPARTGLSLVAGRGAHDSPASPAGWQAWKPAEPTPPNARTPERVSRLAIRQLTR